MKTSWSSTTRSAFMICGKVIDMRVKEIRAQRFRRFTDLHIDGLPGTARLVVLLGINGTGKTSVFDAFNHWKRQQVVDYYHPKFQQDEQQTTNTRPQPTVNITFHDNAPTERRKAVYLRSAYRNEAHFQASSIAAAKPVEEEEYDRLQLLVNDDRRVHQNYNRIVANTIFNLFGDEGADDQTTRRQLRDAFIGPLRESMRRVFGDLVLQGVGDPHRGGTFLFEKGQAKGFPHVNLSAGEKDAFDLLLDIFLRKEAFSNAAYCIDEPDLHMHSKLQGTLLAELCDLIPTHSQLWIATHSIGMIKKAMDIERSQPGSVVFLDFSDRDYDQSVVIKPVPIDRSYWKKFLAVALDDLASLVAPARIVICEGRPLGTTGRASRQEFDAKCLRRIFQIEFPDTEFLSVGNSDDVAQDTLKLSASLERVIDGVTFVRVIDRDGRTETEIAELVQQGIRVLRRRHLESYMLDDAVLQTLCQQQGKADRFEQLKNARDTAFASARQRGNDGDDAKAAAGEFFNWARQLLEIENAGSNWETFFAEYLAGALQPGQQVYVDLKQDIFGEAPT